MSINNQLSSTYSQAYPPKKTDNSYYTPKVRNLILNRLISDKEE